MQSIINKNKNFWRGEIQKTNARDPRRFVVCNARENERLKWQWESASYRRTSSCIRAAIILFLIIFILVGDFVATEEVYLLYDMRLHWSKLRCWSRTRAKCYKTWHGSKVTGFYGSKIKLLFTLFTLERIYQPDCITTSETQI